MHPHRSEIVDELSWHFEAPGRVYLLMTEAERRQVASKGFLTKQLFDELSARLLTAKPADG